MSSGVPDDVCAACHGRAASALPGVWRWRDVDYRVVRCEQCGTGRSHPMPDDDVLAALYASDFDYQWYRDHLIAKRRDAAMRLAEYRPYVGDRMLDYGGGLGYLSRQARKLGIESVTFDPYAIAGGVAPQSKTWDSVVASHVLEHSNSPEAMIVSMKSFLKPEGRLILAVPNFASRGYREQGMNWVWAQPPVIHVHHFTEEGLRHLLMRSGFSQVEAAYSDRWDANDEADIQQMQHFRQLSQSWAWARQASFAGAGIKRRLIALWTSKARFVALKRAGTRPAGRGRDKAELQIIATATHGVRS